MGELNIPRIDFNLPQFETMILRHGYEAKLFSSFRCPCIETKNDLEYSGQANPNCSICGGTGFVDKEKEDIMTLITTLDKDKQYMIAGSWELGQATATFLAEHEPTFMDKIELQGVLLAFNEVVNPPVSALSPDPQYITLKYYIQSIAAIIDEEGNFFTGYNINDGKIAFTYSGLIPKKFSVKYRVKPSFRIIDFPAEARNYFVKVRQVNPQLQKFPVRAIIKRLDLVR